MARESLITHDGLERLKEELEYLQTTKRREVAERYLADAVPESAFTAFRLHGGAREYL